MCHNRGMIDSLACNIALIPDPAIVHSAIATSKRLEQHGGLFILDNMEFFPHVSLYMTQLKVADVDMAGELLAAIAAQTRVIHAIAVRYAQEEGFIDAEYVRSPQLVALQERVLTAINPIRDGLREKDQRRLERAKGVARTNLEQYGYRGVGELFRPHLTFTRFDAKYAIDTRSLPDPSAFNGPFVGLGLFTMGDHGTCTKKLGEWPLR
jgi:hypothetical protein